MAKYTNKYASEEEIKKIFSVASNPKFRLAFKMMYYLQLRVSEAIRIKREHINFEDLTITIPLQKNNRIINELYPLPRVILRELQAYLILYDQDITACEGYIFFPEQAYRTRGLSTDHINKSAVQQYFEKCIEWAGFNKKDLIYLVGKNGVPRKRISLHTLKASAIQRTLAKTGGNIYKASSLAHHTNTQSTMRYAKNPIHNMELKKISLKEVWDDLNPEF